MHLELLTYRLYRLRRLILLSALPPLAIVLWLEGTEGALAQTLMTLAVLVPVAHAVRYPSAASETLTVSLVLAILLTLASALDPSGGAGYYVGRALALLLLGLILFFVLVTPVSFLLMAGPERGFTISASRRSSLDPEALRAAITLYPGRDLGRTVCGPANEDGIFEVTTEISMQQSFLPEGCTADLDDPDASAKSDSEDGIARMQYYAVVKSTGADHHEIYAFEEPGGAVTCTRYSFRTLKYGTEVSICEAGPEMSAGFRFGMWVQDYMADYLTDEVDRAEGRAPRATRAFTQKLMVIDLANLILPWLLGQGLPKPS